MARRAMLPRFLADLHPRHATPAKSIIVNAGGVALLIPFSFQELIQVDMFLYALALLLEFAALIWLRIKGRAWRGPTAFPSVCPESSPSAFRRRRFAWRAL